ncbi:uncharacterized protein LOC132044538 [Lycium ferocissimum]|uniref:uncharacterized protein LOC132044538 n=1 Tax=Lycium ferocissimum TaxID=112874 RepID=UPI0028164E4B|nr:uncharacterized protein LOC132044538 [Lycium ferocissimum]
MFFIIFFLLHCLNFIYSFIVAAQQFFSSEKSWFLIFITNKGAFFIRTCYYNWLQMQSGECPVVAPHFPPGKLSTFEENDMHETGKTSSIIVSKSSNASATKGSRVHNSCGVADNFVIMTALRSKTLTLRDLLDLSPCFGSASVNELLILTLKDLHKMYPSITPDIPLSNIDGAGMDQALQCFCDTLKSIGAIWTRDDEFIMRLNEEYSQLHNDLRRYGLVLLDEMIKLATERVFDLMDEDDQTRDESSPSDALGRAQSETHSSNGSSLSSPPPTPTSVLSELVTSASQKSKLKVQETEKLNPIDVQRLYFNLLPYAIAQDPNYVVQLTTNFSEQKSEIQAKLGSEVKAGDDYEFGQDFEMLDSPDILLADMDNVSENRGTSTLSSNVIKSPPLTSRNIVTPPSPPPPPPMTSRNIVTPPPPPPPHPMMAPEPPTSPPKATTNIVTTLPPPPPPMTSRNVIAPPSPPPPPSHPMMVPPPPPSQPKTTENIITLPPPPPPPPSQPKTTTKIITLPPPPPPPPSLPKTKTNILTLPPPPPPPKTTTNIITLPPPPPPPSSPLKTTSNIITVPPPPPPPPSPLNTTSNIITIPPPPPPPPSPPKKTTNIVTLPPHPPPPPMTSRSVISPPPPPPPTIGSKGMTPPPPPPPMASNGGVPAPPPPMPMGKRPAPPPPLGFMGVLRVKRAATKLKRSTQMGNLYRLLKNQLEGSSLDSKSYHRMGKVGNSAGGKQGMADALAEMTKRSAYFHQIEEDVKNYAKTIKEISTAIASFKTSDMSELIKFHDYVESHLEKLTDESQVLARFEDFPTKKLEELRMAAALYSKLDTIATTLKNWPIVSPVGEHLDKAESYFNKMKVEIDTLERTKDEEAKKFISHNIHFDFGILVRIKELMVDISSNCMELVMKERREEETREDRRGGSKNDGRKKESRKQLWKAFQFAFRVYSFAGGQDDRADKLTKELAQEIQTYPNQ